MKTMCHNISFIVCVGVAPQITNVYLVIWILRNVCLWDESLFGFVKFLFDGDVLLWRKNCCDVGSDVVVCIFFCLLLFVKYLC